MSETYAQSEVMEEEPDIGLVNEVVREDEEV